MKWLVTINGTHEAVIEADTREEAELNGLKLWATARAVPFEIDPAKGAEDHVLAAKERLVAAQTAGDKQARFIMESGTLTSIQKHELLNYVRMQYNYVRLAITRLEEELKSREHLSSDHTPSNGKN